MATKIMEAMKKLSSSDKLLHDLRTLITEVRQDVARSVNSTLVLLYWKVGERIRKDILKEKRAEYGERILPTVSAKLVMKFGLGFNEKSLRRMVQFAEVFPEENIVATLSRQLGWSHFVEIIPLKDELQREFYAEMCRVERPHVAPKNRQYALRAHCPFKKTCRTGQEGTNRATARRQTHP